MTRARRRSLHATAEGRRHVAALAAVKADYELRRDAVMKLLAAGDIRASEAADLLGCHRSTILRRCKALGIDPRKARAALLVRLSACAEKFGELFEITFTSAGPRLRERT